MLVPLLPSRMKQRNNLIGDWVDAGQVRPFVAAVTGPDADGFVNRFVHWGA